MNDIIARRHAVVELQIHAKAGLLKARDKGSYAYGHKIFEYGASGGYFVAELPDGSVLAFDVMDLISEGLRLGGFEVKASVAAPAPGPLAELMEAVRSYYEHETATERQDGDVVPRGMAFGTVERIALEALAELQRWVEEGGCSEPCCSTGF